MNNAIMRTVIEAARSSPPAIKNYRMCAAVVFRDREIVSFGFPRRKTHPLQKRYCCNKHRVFLHAETDAIVKTNNRKFLYENPKGLIRQTYQALFSVYVARVKQYAPGSHLLITGLAEPCEGCRKMIVAHGIKQIEWTKDGDVII